MKPVCLPQVQKRLLGVRLVIHTDTHIATNQKESLTLVAQLVSLSQVISLLQLYIESVAAINRVFILYGV